MPWSSTRVECLKSSGSQLTQTTVARCERPTPLADVGSMSARGEGPRSLTATEADYAHPAQWPPQAPHLDSGASQRQDM